MATTTRGRGIGGGSGRLIIAAFVAIVALVGYFGATQINPVTQEKQHLSMTAEQEIALGKQAAPEMEQQFGGLSQSQELQARVASLGDALVKASDAGKSPYQFEFHVLGDQQTVNAFALPGGQVFITEALMKLLATDGELAGVLSHEIFHVVGRHSAEQAARAELANGLSGAAVMAAYDPNNPASANSAQVAQLIGQMIDMRYGREDELEADNQGVHYMAQAGYDPRAMVSVMQKLEQASNGQQPPEFFSTHPSPERRIEQIQAEINKEFPNGVPDNLKK
ncbi:MAG TPA: M48 family metalloprotease [Kouleothrix sp.]|uniref:M48 family metalloprotease n=1 Tax=Kouleothrix sp. TaxID=2779161 RepID=UPI002C667028|nr:M48 family metalloprotease [Kouleothrix sp.]HRC74097.1 M48 family metalloprotease [Kouleothrix sp.]